jgi:lysophospholipase L1-like esterase
VSQEVRTEKDLLGAEGASTLLGDVSALDGRVEAALASTKAGMWELAIAAVVFLAAAFTVPYASGQLERFRPWMPGDGVPVARLFTRPSDAESGMAIATGGAVREGAAEDDEGAALALSNLEEVEAVVAPPPLEQPRPGQPGPAVRIEASELEGLVREIEDEDGRAMRPFYEALLRTARREQGAITRVAHYGDSSIAGDGITSTLRQRLQQRFGDAGHGFVLIARGTMPYRHQDVRHEGSDNWRLNQLVRAGLREHTYGYGGVQYRSPSGASARFGTAEEGPIGTHVSRFELWFQRHERGGNVTLRLDGGEPTVLSTRGDAMADDWHVVDVPDGAHQLEIRTAGGGESRLYGMVMERAGPGVVYDSLGMVGARARRMLGYDPAHFARQHAHRGTNLIVLGFGGNDADDRLSSEAFEEDFRRVARLVRQARPEAACLLMAPLDQAENDERGNTRTMDSVPIIVEAMRRAAAAEGCAFFDTWTAMGGDGAMRRWFRMNPRLAFGDYRHATPAGYRVIGNMLYKALLKGFSDYLATQRR